MKIPLNMTEQQVINLIQKVSRRLSKKFTFGTYTRDDIEQEAFIQGMECLERYDEERPLENFLCVHISNRLHDLRRNKHFTISSNPDINRINEKKRLLLEPINISHVREHNENSMVYDDTVINDHVISDMSLLIDLFLETGLRTDYLKIKQGIYIMKSRREEIYAEIRLILKRNGYEPEDWGENDVV